MHGLPSLPVIFKVPFVQRSYIERSLDRYVELFVAVCLWRAQ